MSWLTLLVKENGPSVPKRNRPNTIDPLINSAPLTLAKGGQLKWQAAHLGNVQVPFE